MLRHAEGTGTEAAQRFKSPAVTQAGIFIAGNTGRNTVRRRAGRPGSEGRIGIARAAVISYPGAGAQLDIGADDQAQVIADQVVQSRPKYGGVGPEVMAYYQTRQNPVAGIKPWISKVPRKSLFRL